MAEAPFWDKCSLIRGTSASSRHSNRKNVLYYFGSAGSRTKTVHGKYYWPLYRQPSLQLKTHNQGSLPQKNQLHRIVSSNPVPPRYGLRYYYTLLSAICDIWPNQPFRDDLQYIF